jgi:N-acetylglucosamine repressor
MDSNFPEIITTNEQRILTLIYKIGPMSKQDICDKGQMSWATAVKLVKRLTEQGILHQAGTSYRPVEQRGKNSYIYELTGTAPLAVGIDIEYQTTSMEITNLSGKILYSSHYPTPESPDPTELFNFIKIALKNFLAQAEYKPSNLVGIGIGIPGISIPSWTKDPENEQKDLGPALEDEFTVPVVIENNVRAYAVYEKWDRNAFSLSNFIFISIRTGVGSGIFINDHLYSGNQGLAGELGHFLVVDSGLACRCGNYGCLETVVNQNILYEAYREKVLHSPVRASSYEHSEVLSGLNNLFRTANDGNIAANEVIKTMIEHLGPCIADLIKVLNIPHVIISGYFGDYGQNIIPALEKEVQRYILKKMNINIKYFPFDKKGFTRGAALLILKKFFTGISDI